MSRVPLGVLDLVPVSSGSTAGQALLASRELARRAEEFGYARYWFAEHHLNPGVAGTSPAVVLALVGAATSSIRLGSAAVLMGHRTALATVEEFGLLDAAFPGRIDLGLGRSGGRPPDPSRQLVSAVAPVVVDGRAPNGLRIPEPVSLAHLFGSPRIAMQQALLQLPGAKAQDYAEQVADVLALLAGTYRSAAGEEAHVVPGEGAALQVWILGSSGGESATVAGENGLRFGANYHVAPSAVLDAVAGYRAAFVPSTTVPRPYVTVSADVVVGPDDASARRIAEGYGPWVHSIRSARGAIPYPSPEEAQGLALPEAEHTLVADRLETRFVGSPARVADGLEQLRDATGADEVLLTTITHDLHDRIRSYELLADEWARR